MCSRLSSHPRFEARPKAKQEHRSRSRTGRLRPDRSAGVSAFTRVAACTLALSPIHDTLIEGFSHFVTSMTAPIASGWSVAGWGLHHWKAAPLAAWVLDLTAGWR